MNHYTFVEYVRVVYIKYLKLKTTITATIQIFMLYPTYLTSKCQVFDDLYPLLAQFKCQLCARLCLLAHSGQARDSPICCGLKGKVVL
jgi:hypothetical protein